jgi:hypothetical protein
MAIEKLIITHKTALQKKYATQFPKIVSLLKKIVAADKNKGLQSKYVFLDDAKMMKSFKARVVTKAANENQHKNALDDLYHFFRPDYILIFGAPDIVPFQSLINDNYIATMSNRSSDDDDDEKMVDSDLPYACEAVYNKNKRVQNYISPSRVVGRLPDITGKPDLAYFSKVVDFAIDWKPLSAFPKNIFSLSTATWNKITDRIVLEAFGEKHTSYVSPTRKEGDWKKAELFSPIHLINCHGGNTDARFWGENAKTGEMEPASINSQDINKKIREGTVVVAECCFGGQLYEPRPNLDLPMSICNSYLANGAIGYVGSSCSAFGAINGEKFLYNADLIAKYFLRHLLNGASLGRAFLETRQEYFSKFNQPDPIDYKTLAQFNLMGDPSLHFCIAKEAAPKSKKKTATTYFNPHRKGRRAELEIKASELNNTVSSLKEVSSVKSKSLKNEIEVILRKNKLDPKNKGKTFAIQLPNLIRRGSKSVRAKKSHTPIDLKYSVYSATKRIKMKGLIIKKQRVLILRELNGQVVDQKLVVSK